MTDTLDGVRGQGRRDDRKYARALARRGQVAYFVVEPARNERPRDDGPRDHRAAGRKRTRLRSAKILDSANKFVCDCLIHDRSASGLRLTLAQNLGLPAHFRVYEDESGEVDVVETVWRRGAVLGVRYSRALGMVSIKPSDRAALRGQFYAIPD
ncbi:MAG: hypothetical protein ABSC22_06325 [Roseiarcus sp.]|jgi:hypothetical protein